MMFLGFSSAGWELLLATLMVKIVNITNSNIRIKGEPFLFTFKLPTNVSRLLYLSIPIMCFKLRRMEENLGYVRILDNEPRFLRFKLKHFRRRCRLAKDYKRSRQSKAGRGAES